MPSIVEQLSAQRQPSALRTVVKCPASATMVLEGPATSSQPATSWIAFLCPAHANLPNWRGVATHAFLGSAPCGSIMDFRPIEQLLDSHAELWLTPLTNVRPEIYAGVWSDVLEDALHAFHDQLRHGTNPAASGPLEAIMTMMMLACRSAENGDLDQTATTLSYCEMIALDLLKRP
ncbi:hypothetical protein ACICHK_42490 (plasmid) [Streptomyces sp. AHU1]|uniref:hypothetical protein n=1 Tax=Streptomyces sp. AHU1 TaxID=3377215 RepID=UPI003877D239